MEPPAYGLSFLSSCGPCHRATSKTMWRNSFPTFVQEWPISQRTSVVLLWRFYHGWSRQRGKQQFPAREDGSKHSTVSCLCWAGTPKSHRSGLQAGLHLGSPAARASLWLKRLGLWRCFWMRGSENLLSAVSIVRCLVMMTRVPTGRSLFARALSTWSRTHLPHSHIWICSGSRATRKGKCTKPVRTGTACSRLVSSQQSSVESRAPERKVANWAVHHPAWARC